MRAREFVDEDLTRRGFLRGMGAAAMAGAAGSALAQNANVSDAFKNLRQDDPRIRHAQDVDDLAKAMYQNMVAQRGQPMDRQQQNQWMEIAREKAAAKFSQYRPGAQPPAKPAAEFPSQGSEYRRSRNIDNFESVAEAFDNPYKGKWEKSDYGDVDLNTKLPDGTNLSIMFNQEYGEEGEEVVQVEFYRNNSQEVTGEGDAQRIFATVIDSIQKYIKKYKPQRLSFSASKAVDMDADDNGAQFNPESRAKLYDRLVQRYSKALGYRAFRADNGDIVIYELSRLKPAVAEGKQPGKPVVDAILKVMPVTQEIWFHGSRATGQHRKNSDTDILVVIPDDLVGDQYLSVVRILQKLSSHFDNYDIQPTRAGTNIHRIAQEEGRLLWSSKQGVAEEQLDELSFLGSECTKDCSGHRAGYEWSKRKGLRQANSWSPSFNKGAGLAVAGK